MKKNTTGITIATSIAPFNVPHQQGAIDSWLDLGFSVVSVNSPDEINELREYFPRVSFISAGRSAKSMTGKPFVYFDDILAALYSSGSDVCGIVNSDIYLKVSEGFSDFIEAEAHSSLIFASRIDVEIQESLHGQESSWGFDVFFMDRSVISLYPPTQFCLGVPWWDYWAPLIPLLHGVPVKRLISPVAFHLIHDSNWSMELYESFGRRYLSYLGASEIVNVGKSRHALRQPSLMIHAALAVVYIKARAGKLYYPSRGTNVPPRTLSELDTTKELVKFFLKGHNLVGDPENERAALATELDNVRQSLSWRITRPLRWLKEQLSKVGARLN